MKLYKVIGVIDPYGHCQALSVYKEDDGTLSQLFPGHWYIRNQSFHKRWTWLVEKNKLDRGPLMDWEPDVEEMDRIEREVKKRIEWDSKPHPRCPRFSIEGEYPTWEKVYDPK